MTRRTLVVLTLIAGGQWLGQGGALAQEADAKPHVPLAKTIGQVTQTAPIPSLFVLNSDGATLEGTTLTMTGVSPNSIVFADRPARAAGHLTTEQFIMQWDEGKDSFAKDPPNATVSILGGDGSKVRDAVVTLMKPKLDAGNLSFEVAVLEGSLSGTGPAALFIDHGGGFGGGGGGRGFGGGNAGGFAGGDRPGDDVRLGGDRLGYDRVGRAYRGNYWHAPVYHGAWYAGGLDAGLADEAAADRSYYGYGPEANGYAQCGYYPYPPCY